MAKDNTGAFYGLKVFALVIALGTQGTFFCLPACAAPSVSQPVPGSESSHSPENCPFSGTQNPRQPRDQRNPVPSDLSCCRHTLTPAVMPCPEGQPSQAQAGALPVAAAVTGLASDVQAPAGSRKLPTPAPKTTPTYLRISLLLI